MCIIQRVEILSFISPFNKKQNKTKQKTNNLGTVLHCNSSEGSKVIWFR